jgi:hypothetical protein
MYKTTVCLWSALVWISVVVFGVGMGMTIAPLQAQAMNLCRTIEHHEVCIMSIKRSAKNFWEYQAAISIDGKRGRSEPYNCRSQYKTDADGRLERFGKDSIGSLVCRAYRPLRSGMPLELNLDAD